MDPDFDDLRVIVIFSERRDEGFTPERFLHLEGTYPSFSSMGPILYEIHSLMVTVISVVCIL